MATMFSLKVAVLATCLGFAASESYRLPCYFTVASYNSNSTFNPEKYEPGLCTHIFYAYAQVVNDEIQAFDIQDLVTSDGYNGYYYRINELKYIQPGLKTVISVGGNTTPREVWQKTLSTDENRATFAVSAVDFLLKHNFDGIEIWYVPEAFEMDNFVSLIKLLKRTFDESGKLVTVAVPQFPDDDGYDVETLAEYVDFVNVMTYDFIKPTAKWIGYPTPLYSPQYEVTGPVSYPPVVRNSVDDSLQAWAKAGMPKKQINMMVVGYGMGWVLENPDWIMAGAPATAVEPFGVIDKAGCCTYYEICGLVEQNDTVNYWKDVASVPYFVNEGRWFTYENVASLALKMFYIRTEGFGGATFWGLHLDDFDGICPKSQKPFPLLLAAGDALGLHSAATNNEPTLPTFDGTTTGVTEKSSTTTEAPTDGTTTNEATTEAVTETTTETSPVTDEPATTTSEPSEATTPEGSPVTAEPSTTTSETTTEATTEASPATDEPVTTTLEPLEPTTPEDTQTTTDSSETTTELPTTPFTFTCPTPVGYFSDPESCQWFYQCSHNIAYHLECPNGTLWDQPILTCNHADQVYCAL
uniref:Glyco_18 domain-containing protein n=1 Tax=Panagrellus redivivus TaxID=6233 RepID=A0A7E4UPC0_PANRE